MSGKSNRPFLADVLISSCLLRLNLNATCDLNKTQVNYTLVSGAASCYDESARLMIDLPESTPHV
jgi:hypothetical protein